MVDDFGDADADKQPATADEAVKKFDGRVAFGRDREECLFCPSIMLLWIWDESNTALLAMIGSGLVPTACLKSQQ